MKVTHVIHSIDRSKGGPSTYMQLLTEKLVEQMKIEVVTLDTPDPIPLNSLITHHSSQTSSLGLFGYSPDMRNYLQNTKTDIFHGNGLWQYPVYAMAKAARKRKIPYILSTHGMLEPWSMTQGKWKKWLALSLFQSKDLHKADVIHCTADMEAESLRKKGYTNPIAVIPNGIDIDQFKPAGQKESEEKKNLLFISRIHPKKGLEMLIDAWAAMGDEHRKNWQLQIAGNGEEYYIQTLRKMIHALGLEASIQILGPVFGKEKLQLYQNASLFILPTYSENFGIVIAEALACGVPVITTKGAPWEDLEKAQCGWWIPATTEAIGEVLITALAKNRDDLNAMGLRGRRLVEEKYNMQTVAGQMIALYQWLINKQEKPAFVN